MSSVKYLIQNNILLIEILQEALDLTNIVKIKSDIDEVVKEIDLKQIVKIFVDMKNIKYVDSSGIGILISIKKRFQTDIYLKNTSQNVKDVIKLTSLDSMFHLDYDNL